MLWSPNGIEIGNLKLHGGNGPPYSKHVRYLNRCDKPRRQQTAQEKGDARAMQWIPTQPGQNGGHHSLHRLYLLLQKAMTLIFAGPKSYVQAR